MAVRAYLQSLPQVQNVHDLHVWGMDTSESALTAHLVLKDEELVDTDALLRTTSAELARRFDIRHVTLQLESSDALQRCVSDLDDCAIGSTRSGIGSLHEQ